MKVSLITATYNSAATLENSLQSVSNQDYPLLEQLVVDGNSSDGTLAIIKKYQVLNKQLHFISERDKGIYDALNKGIALATGDIVGIVHSDDFLSNSGIISQIVSQFKEQGADGVYGDLDYVERGNADKILRAWKSRDFYPGLLHRGWMPPHPTLFLKKEVYLKYGNYNLNYKIAADYDFMLRIFSDNSLKFSYLPQVITKMRMGGVSNRSLSNLVQKSSEDYRALKNNNIGFPLKVLMHKNISKIPQFI